VTLFLTHANKIRGVALRLGSPLNPSRLRHTRPHIGRTALLAA
jgi:hypothetical protein